MKKKTPKKLVLAKETVKNLGEDKLQEIAGGMVSYAGCRTLTNTGGGDGC